MAEDVSIWGRKTEQVRRETFEIRRHAVAISTCKYYGSHKFAIEKFAESKEKNANCKSVLKSRKIFIVFCSRLKNFV